MRLGYQAVQFFQEEKKPQGLQKTWALFSLFPHLWQVCSTSVCCNRTEVDPNSEHSSILYPWLEKVKHLLCKQFFRALNHVVGGLHITTLSPHITNSSRQQSTLWYGTNSEFYLGHLHTEPDFGEYSSCIQDHVQGYASLTRHSSKGFCLHEH